MKTQLLMLVTLSALGTFAEGERTLSEDGKTLTFNVAAGAVYTNTVIIETSVTNIVKMGDGVMTAVSMADYTGDFTIREGYWLVDADGDLGCKNVGVVRIECDPSTKNGGALKMADNTASGALTYQTIYVAGNGPDGTGAIRGPYSVSGNYSTQLQYMTYILTDDAIWLNDGFPFRFTYSTLDVAGHTLTFRAKSEFSQAGYFTCSTITNSVPEQGGGVRTVSGTTPVTGRYCKFQLDGPSTWLGGANNTFATDYRMYIGKTDGDWTCLFNGKQIWGANAAASTAVSDANYWSGSVSVTASTTVGNNESIRTGQWTQVSMPYPIAFNGQKIVPIEFLKALLPDPASLGPRTKGKTNIGCIFHGRKNGKPVDYYVYQVCDHQACYREVGSQAISYTTGVPAMIGAKMFLEGKWTAKGVHTCEEFDPDPFMAALKKQGLPWKETFKPVKVP